VSVVEWVQLLVVVLVAVSVAALAAGLVVLVGELVAA